MPLTENEQQMLAGFQIGGAKGRQDSIGTYNAKEMVNNTNDLNPMIMMSGEDGSASHSNISAVNLTNITQPGFMAGTNHIHNNNHFGSSSGFG